MFLFFFPSRKGINIRLVLTSIVLQGFAIGNGLTDPAIQYPAYPDYALEMGLITQAEHDRLEKIVPLCELSIKLCGTSSILVIKLCISIAPCVLMDHESLFFSGTDGTTSCLASYLVCNTLFTGVMKHAGGVNVSPK